ncbi:MAG: SpoIIE family protein phosphatase [bacterium]|nr:SpoIIE family protein phosphatase [bacterium]
MEYYPFKNILTRALGINEKVEIDIFSGEIHKNDYFLLTSDGLSDKIKNEKILKVVLNYIEPEIICQELLFYINQKISFDDKSLIVVYIQEEQGV